MAKISKKIPYIVIMITVWKRPHVFKLVCDQLSNFIRYNSEKTRISVVFVISKNDPHIYEILKIINNQDFVSNYEYSDNSALGDKHNVGIEMALKLKPDYIMNCGSDDLLHPYLIDFYLPYILKKIPIIGLSRLYFYHKKKVYHYSYYNNPHVIGAGRLLLAKCVKKCLPLYNPDLKRGLDCNSANKLLINGNDQAVLDPGEFPFLVDVKSAVNINAMQQIIDSSNDNLKEVNERFLFHTFPALERFVQ